MSMEISSRKNEIIQHIRLIGRERKYREQHGEFLIEGSRLCAEALEAGLTINRALITKNAAQRYARTAGMLAEICDVIIISEDLSQYISDTKSPQGIFLIAKFLDKFSFFDTIKSKQSLLALDNLQDSGNVGTIIRSCDAFSVGGLLLSEDCADIYSPKVIRSTMGSLFRLPVFSGNLAEMLQYCAENGYNIYGAMLDDSAKKLADNVFNGVKSLVVIGNEGKGISEEIAALCSEKLYIPISSAESLNAGTAASIIAWELSKAISKQ